MHNTLGFVCIGLGLLNLCVAADGSSTHSLNTLIGIFCCSVGVLNILIAQSLP